jgi:hypothetical protein
VSLLLKSNAVSGIFPSHDALSPYKLTAPNSRLRCDLDHEAFVRLLAAYNQCGGLARGDDLAPLLQGQSSNGYVNLASLMAQGKVFGFKHHALFWVPMFQFVSRQLSVRPEVEKVLAAFPTRMADCDLAQWWVAPNKHLQGQMPVFGMSTCLAQVVEAARADFLTRHSTAATHALESTHEEY